MTNRTKSEFTSHCRIAAKTNFLMLFPARFAHARYSSRMIDRFLNWGDHGKPKSGKVKGRCQPPLVKVYTQLMYWKFDNCYLLRFPAATFLSECYVYNLFPSKVLQTVASNCYKVRGSENLKWRWILRLTAVNSFALSVYINVIFQ